MILQLLVARLAVDIGYSGCFDSTFIRCLLIHVLESVLIKVNRCRTESLGGRLLIGQLTGKAFETNAYFLSGQKFVYRTSIMR